MENFKALRYHVFEQQQKEGVAIFEPIELEPEIVPAPSEQKIEAIQEQKKDENKKTEKLPKKKEKYEEWKPYKTYKPKAKNSVKIKKELKPHNPKNENTLSIAQKNHKGASKIHSCKGNDLMKEHKENHKENNTLMVQKVWGSKHAQYWSY